MSDIDFVPVDRNLSRSLCGNYTMMQSNGFNNYEIYKLYRNGAEIATEKCRNSRQDRLDAVSTLVDVASEDASNR